MNFSRDMKNLKNRRKGKAGFTMSELLIVVAIVIVLFAVAVLSLVTIRKNLRQKELDSKAEILYVAVQNRMSELRAGGYESLYQYDEKRITALQRLVSFRWMLPKKMRKTHHKRHALLRRFRRPRGGRQGGSFRSAGIFRRCRALEQPLGYRVRPRKRQCVRRVLQRRGDHKR